MDYKKARRIWRNNFPDILKQGHMIIGGVSFGKYTMPRFKSNQFYYDVNKAKELKDASKSNESK